MYSSVGGHMDALFHLMAIVTEAVVNMHLQIFM